jgi:hypothetical protein
VDQHPEYWRYARDSLLADIAADLVGPDVKFHHSKLNFKWARSGAEVKWHQDIQYWPHTNYSPLTFGTYLYDCSMAQAHSECCRAATWASSITPTTPTAAGPDRCPTRTPPPCPRSRPPTCPARPAR